MNVTEEQRAAIQCAGKVIVSASAGSGKTFVMRKKLVAAVEGGADLDSVLAVTFTKKAAAQMKEKLRKAVIERIATADAKVRTHLKNQLTKISTSNISTIHAFCARLLRTYFYCVGVDGTFDIISAEDAAASEFKSRALDNMFERYYKESNPHFMHLLKCYRKKRSDGALRALILEGYEKLRINAGYLDNLNGVESLYTDEGFARVCAEYSAHLKEKIENMKSAVREFAASFENLKKPVYDKIFGEMFSALDAAGNSDIFAPLPPFTVTRKPVDCAADRPSGEKFKTFKEALLKSYAALRGDTEDGATEKKRFLESGKTAVAFAAVLKDFDAEYTLIKREENKLDYNDLEHLTLSLLEDGRVRGEINSRFNYVFVDEYQDVNPVQEEIISCVSGKNVFLVGDVKQAIYGFRGSRSLFFAEKYNSFEGGGGSALRLSSNFRSSDGVLDFVNGLFSSVMTAQSCGFDYSSGSIMRRGGGYPEGFGSACIHVFGKDEEEKGGGKVYSVKAGAKEAKHTREGLAVLEIVERELKEKHFDLNSGEFVDTQAGDICILTRKRGNAETAAIVRALTDAGYSVSGAQDLNICTRPEVKQMLDILSYIDNSAQDIPLVTALLSPMGGFTCDELAAIRIAYKNNKKQAFRDCCKSYLGLGNALSEKLKKFYLKAEELRSFSQVLTAAELIDKICEETGLEAVYSSGGGARLKNIRRLAAEGEGLSVSSFLAKVKAGGYDISASGASSSDSIKIMTMHASKGLEFPVVIIADVCATFKGRDYCEMPLHEKFGFAPKCHDTEKMLVRPTVLRRLSLALSEREELKNELNLFYVACTRAMCRLHIMAQEIKPFNAAEAAEAKSYSKLFDIAAYPHEDMPPRPDFGSGRKVSPVLVQPDAELQSLITERFMREYPYAESVNLPVKSSASAILKRDLEEPKFRTHELFPEENAETGAERGTAYHAFLELCDFKKKNESEIEKQLEIMLKSRRITEGQYKLLNVAELCEILSMPVFGELDGARLYKEQEFLCRLPANEILETRADDDVLVQGAIDLLAVRGGCAWVIDYKYSKKDDSALKETYCKQLSLYKKAVSVILGIKPENIRTVIVNIKLRRQIVLYLP